MDTKNVQKTFHFVCIYKYRKNQLFLKPCFRVFSTKRSLYYFCFMSLNFENLSFWEKKWLTDSVDFLIVGAGIVGLSAAFHLKMKFPKAKIVVIDKGILPFSASSKNAGFACFGSPSEILDDLQNIPETDVWKTVEMRWKGLIELKKWLGEEQLDLQNLGSWDLMELSYQSEEIRDKMSVLNKEIHTITGQHDCFSEDKTAISRFGFEQIDTCFYNKLEGQLDTSKLIRTAIQKVQNLDINIIRGVHVESYITDEKEVNVQTNFGPLKTQNLILCTNGFSSEIDQELPVKPARAQVLITNEIHDLKIEGTFHIDRGYYYFRNVGKRLLIGGGRNINFKNEQTTDLAVSEEIQTALEEKLHKIVLPKTSFTIEQRWSGIMGVGSKKEPIIERLNDKVVVGIRMGGMGVAIGTLVGQNLADMHS
jgi:gamma-glutamylputrescine oxidase